MIEVREDFTSELSEVVLVVEGQATYSLGHYVQTRGGSFVVIPSYHHNLPPSEVETKQEAIELLQRPVPT